MHGPKTLRQVLAAIWQNTSTPSVTPTKPLEVSSSYFSRQGGYRSSTIPIKSSSVFAVIIETSSESHRSFTRTCVGEGSLHEQAIRNLSAYLLLRLVRLQRTSPVPNATNNMVDSSSSANGSEKAFSRHEALMIQTYSWYFR